VATSAKQVICSEGVPPSSARRMEQRNCTSRLVGGDKNTTPRILGPTSRKDLCGVVCRRDTGRGCGGNVLENLEELEELELPKIWLWRVALS